MLSKAVRKNSISKPVFNSGDTDELALLFMKALVWDGDHPSKDSRDYLIEGGWAERREGYTALTGKGKIAALTCWPMPRTWFRLWRRGRLKNFK